MPANIRPPRVKYRQAARFAAEAPEVLSGDGAVPIDQDNTFVITKGSAIAATVAAPGAANIGRRLTFHTATDFAHVITFTGSTLRDGTTGASITYTATAFRGCALTVRAIDASTWAVESMNLGAIA